MKWQRYKMNSSKKCNKKQGGKAQRGNDILAANGSDAAQSQQQPTGGRNGSDAAQPQQQLTGGTTTTTTKKLNWKGLNNTITKKKGKKKDPNVPKIAMNAYMIYSAHIRPSVKEENPEASFGDISGIISAKYKALDDDQRKVFVERAKVDLARYKSEMANYNGQYFLPRWEENSQVLNHADGGGREMNTGHWSQAEHNRFLTGLDQYGIDNWKKVIEIVGTRTSKQIQNHARRYVIKTQSVIPFS